MSSIVKMNYGKASLDIEVPQNRILAVADLNEVDAARNERAEVERALDNPIGHKGIDELAKKKTVVVVDDNTRPTPVNRILPILLDRLNEAGIEDGDISVLIALGTHRVMSDSEVREKVGAEALERVSVTNHYWKRKDMLVDMGKTPSGVPLSVNRCYLEANVRIGVGYIVPHCQAGWTGGAKIIQPGVCGAETTDYTHWLSARFDVRHLIGVANNPVRLEIENVVRNIGLDLFYQL
jgi:nickel-dependent lactate racemase